MGKAGDTASGERRWTAAQHAAIEHLGGDLLVSAAAGSGKTAVLAERCARLVTREGLGRTTVDRLLVLTFTDAAANEMRTRIARALRAAISGEAGESEGAGGGQAGRPSGVERAVHAAIARQLAMVERANISTLHAFCARVLRSYFHEAQLDPAFEVFDDDEARLLREDILQQTLARWHQDDAEGVDAAQAAAFDDFYEAFAQGDEGRLAGIIGRLHAMLESVPDPTAWLAAAREMYSENGAAATRERYIAGVARELAVRVPALARQITVVGRADNCEALARVMTGYRDLLGSAHDDLIARGAEAWDSVAARIRAFEWGRLLTPKSAPQFGELRESIREPAKKDLKKLCEITFAAFNSAEQLLADLRVLAGPLDVLLRLTQDFQVRYTGAKRRQNCLDFSDLERLTLDLLTRPGSAAARELQSRFDHILVDEFQDINPLQAALLAAVRDPAKHGSRGNLFVVGDVKQAIYGFRLADPEQFLLRERSARAVTTHAAFVALQHNFRSRPALLMHLNAIFERLLTPEVAGVDYSGGGHALQPPEKETGALAPATTETAAGTAALRPFAESIECHWMVTDASDDSVAAGRDADGDAEKESANGKRTASDASAEEAARESEAAEGTHATDGGGDRKTELEATTLSAVEQEARMVAERIADLMLEGRAVREKSGELRPLRYRDIAILLRGARGRAPLFTRALAERGIPVHADLATGFFDAEEISHTLALLALLDNPRQDIPLATVMLSPYFRCADDDGVSRGAATGGAAAPSFTHDDLALIRLAFPRKSEVPFHQAVMNYLAGIPSEFAAAPSVHRSSPMENPTLLSRLRAFFALLDRYRRWVRTAPLHEALADIFRDQHLLTYVAGLADGRQRAANLQALQQRALQFAGFRQQGLHRFLRFIDRLRETEGDFGEAPVLSEASDVVRIMTIHKSKGLEFPVVFVSTLGVKFNLDRSGAVMIDRDEHVGLQFADVPRNVYRPTAASELIAAARRRNGRAEELRLLYVAMTRARDHLILTGAIKQASLERLNESARHHAGPLAEETLLRANTFLDYIVPVAAAPAVQPHIQVTTHAPLAAMPPMPAPEVAARLTQLQQHAPLADAAAAPSSIVSDLLARLTSRYAWEPLAKMPAKVSVSELKRALFDGEEVPDADLAALDPGAAGGRSIEQRTLKIENSPITAASILAPPSASPAIARGIATHRLFELLDFAAVVDAATLQTFIAEQIRTRRLMPEQAALIDQEQVRWFLSTEFATRLRAALVGGAASTVVSVPRAPAENRKSKIKHVSEPLPLFAAPSLPPSFPPAAAPDTVSISPAAAVQIYREIPFIYPLSPADLVPDIDVRMAKIESLADAPLLRGIIDLLVLTTDTIEIIDYKTDDPRFLAAHLPAYRRQMHYYARAAAAILRQPVSRATLVLLGPRELLTIENPAMAVS